MPPLTDYLNGFLSLLFPDVCQACGRPLIRGEEVLCTFCLHDLPYTGFHLEEDNKTAKLFWGRAPVTAAASCLYFRKGEKVQRLMHRLKYRNQQKIGRFLGMLYGKQLKEVPGFAEADFICPLPLHRKSLQKRGYNQSDCFAEGLAASMEKEARTGLLLRTTRSGSQTRRSRYDRFLNVRDAFSVTAPEKILGKHLLLADDVVTTGATLCSCAAEILKVEGTRVSVATIAYSS